MRKRLIVAMLAAVAVLAVPMIATGATGITGHLTGAEVVNPNGGDPNGSANITLRVNRVKGRVCFVLTYKKLSGHVTGAFLHKGAEGEIARPIVTLFEGDHASPVQACVHDLRPRIVKRLKQKPDAHYVDVDTSKYPDGAIRGQLER
jgi:CHRD domain